MSPPEERQSSIAATKEESVDTIIQPRGELRTEWPGRPTRANYLRPHGLRERIGARLARKLLLRWDRELGAETMRAEDGWKSYIEAKRAS